MGSNEGDGEGVERIEGGSRWFSCYFRVIFFGGVRGMYVMY